MYECPNCGQNLKFSIEKQAMHCEYCDSVIDPYKVTDAYAVEEQKKPTMEVKILTCPQCGGEIVCDDNEATTFCSFCGASTMLESRIDKVQKPTKIIPFKKTKADCIAAYKSMMRKAFFAPKEAKDPANIESFRAIYMPYWLYDFKGTKNLYYNGRKVYQKGDYEYTEHYSISTNAQYDYEDVGFDASASFSDDLSSAIGTFNMKDAKPFSTAFMSGYYADVCDVSKNVYESDAENAVAYDMAKRIANNRVSMKYHASREEIAGRLELDHGFTELAMFPVWFMSYRKQGKKGDDRVMYVAINGETGKAVADTPVSLPKYFAASALLAVIIFLILNLTSFNFKPIVTAVIAACCTVIFCIMAAIQEQDFRDKESYKGDKGRASAFKQKALSKQTKKKAKIGSEFPILMCISILCVIVLGVWQPAADLWYYLGAIICLLSDVCMLVELIFRHNKLSGRPLPQFKRKGGNDSVTKEI